MDFMKLAIIEANKCIPIKTAFCVGAVLVDKNGTIISTGYSREIPINTHAEQVCLIKAKDIKLNECTMYSTMEPCGERLSGAIPCSKLLIGSGVDRVVVGIREPDTFIKETRGIKILEDAGIRVEFLKGLEDECWAPNNQFLD